MHIDASHYRQTNAARLAPIWSIHLPPRSRPPDENGYTRVPFSQNLEVNRKNSSVTHARAIREFRAKWNG